MMNIYDDEPKVKRSQGPDPSTIVKSTLDLDSDSVGQCITLLRTLIEPSFLETYSTNYKEPALHLAVYACDDIAKERVKHLTHYILRQKDILLQYKVKIYLIFVGNVKYFSDIVSICLDKQWCTDFMQIVVPAYIGDEISENEFVKQLIIKI